MQKHLVLASGIGLLVLSQVVACGDDDDDPVARGVAGTSGSGGRASGGAAGSSAGSPGSGGTVATGGAAGQGGVAGATAGAGGSSSDFCEQFCAKVSELNCPKQNECSASCKAAQAAGAKCPTETQAVESCLLSKPISDFECQGDAPRAKSGVCGPEYAAALACATGAGGAGGVGGQAGAAGASGSGGAPAVCEPACSAQQTCVDGTCKLKDGQECDSPDQCASGLCPGSVEVCVPADPGTCTSTACEPPGGDLMCQSSPHPTETDNCNVGRVAESSCVLGNKGQTCEATCTCVLAE